MGILEFIAAAGLGAVIGTVIQSFWTERLATKQRNFQEKKEAYSGFLNACHRSEIEQTEEAAKYVGHWVNICEIVGSAEVRNCLAEHMKTNPINGEVHPGRPDAMKKLKQAMRKDLGFPKD